MFSKIFLRNPSDYYRTIHYSDSYERDIDEREGSDGDGDGWKKRTPEKSLFQLDPELRKSSLVSMVAEKKGNFLLSPYQLECIIEEQKVLIESVRIQLRHLTYWVGRDPAMRKVEPCDNGGQSFQASCSETIGVQLHPYVNKSSLASIAGKRWPSPVITSSSDPMIQAAHRFLATIVAEEKNLYCTVENKDSFKGTDSVQLLLRVLQVHPCRLLLSEEERLNLDIEKELEELLVEGAALNGSAPDAVYWLTASLLRQMRCIFPIDFHLEPETTPAPRPWWFPFLRPAKKAASQQGLITFGMNWNHTYYPKRLFRHPFAFMTSNTSPESLTDYEMMREVVASVTTIFYDISRVMHGKAFSSITNNETERVMDLVYHLTEKYKVKAEMGFYGRHFYQAHGLLPKENGAVQISFYQYQRREWRCYERDRIFDQVRHNPCEGKILILIFQDALKALTKRDKQEEYRKITAVLWPGPFRGYHRG